jgi:hypothetical protein
MRIRESDIESLPPQISDTCMSVYKQLNDFAYLDGPFPNSPDYVVADKTLSGSQWALAAFFLSWRGDEQRVFADAEYMLRCYES